jgi:hypothetical protein
MTGKRTAKKATKQPTKEVEVSTIKIGCTIKGHENDYVLFKQFGWKFKHLRLWETTVGVGMVVTLILERMVDWCITDEEGTEIPFIPYLTKKDEKAQKINPDVWDELSPEQAGWLTGAFRIAYSRAGLPSPNA